MPNAEVCKRNATWSYSTWCLPQGAGLGSWPSMTRVQVRDPSRSAMCDRVRHSVQRMNGLKIQSNGATIEFLIDGG